MAPYSGSYTKLQIQKFSINFDSNSGPKSCSFFGFFSSIKLLTMHIINTFLPALWINARFPIQDQISIEILPFLKSLDAPEYIACIATTSKQTFKLHPPNYRQLTLRSGLTQIFIKNSAISALKFTATSTQKPNTIFTR